MHRTYRIAASACAIAVATSLAAPALAQSRQVTTPNTTVADGPITVTLGGNTFTNQGLVGVGRLDANTRDFAGETLGSFSGLALDLKSWRRNADGTYSGVMYTLPDRGPNDVGPFVGTTNYRNRVHTSAITFNPYTGTAALPQSPSSQTQLTIAPTGGFFLTDTTGTNFTGRDALSGSTTRDGVLYPLVQSGDGAGRISLDSEAIALRPDGSFYVSDEYAANIYYFDATGRQLGALNTIPAILPRSGGAANLSGSVTPESGRRNNQGLEALAITPDNNRLVTILQSATVQDTAGSNQQTRNNTRILVYDIGAKAIPSAGPIGHYVLQLPTFDQNGAGAAVNRTAAQSDMLALNSSQFLVLSRDGIGRGTNPTASTTPIFKSVLLVDVSGATNLAGSQFETGVTPLATNGSLVAGIVPAAQVELVNLLNLTQLNRFGLNASTRPSNSTSLSEKYEALGLAPVLEEGRPQDFFLLIGNDNDFITNNGFVNGQSFNASLAGAGGSGNNDNQILVYRLTLPTYVDPQALGALNLTSGDALYGTRMALTSIGASATQPAMRFVNAQRGWSDDGSPRKVRLWLDGEWNEIGAGTSPLTGLNVQTVGGTVGLDVRFADVARAGAFAGYRDFDGTLGFGAPIAGDAWTAGGYVAVELPQGPYAEVSAAWIGDVRFDKVGRLSAYGQQAIARTKGEGWSASGEAGWQVPVGRLTVTPFAAVDYVDLELDGYTEVGASVSNLVFPDREFRKLTASAGGEIAAEIGALRPTLRGGYSMEYEHGDRNATVRLASAQHAMGTVTLPLADTERDSAFGELRIAMRDGALGGYVAARGRWGRGDNDARVSVGASYAF